jgi:FixJ family two-component response regulator
VIGAVDASARRVSQPQHHAHTCHKNLGLGLQARIRNLGVTAPALLMTGIAKDVAKELDARNAGAAGVLYKPIDLRELDDAVAHILRSG